MVHRRLEASGNKNRFSRIMTTKGGDWFSQSYRSLHTYIYVSFDPPSLHHCESMNGKNQKMGFCHEAWNNQGHVESPMPWLSLQPLFALCDSPDSGGDCGHVTTPPGWQKAKSGHKGSLFKSRKDFIHICHNPYSFCCCCLCVKARQGISLSLSFNPIGMSLSSDDSSFRKWESSSKKVMYLLSVYGSPTERENMGHFLRSSGTGVMLLQIACPLLTWEILDWRDWFRFLSLHIQVECSRHYPSNARFLTKTLSALSRVESAQ